MAPTPKHQVPDQLSVHTISPKTKNSLLVRADCILPVPLTVSGDRICLWNSPSLFCSYEHAVHCVCAAWVSLTPYILPSLSQLGLGILCEGVKPPAPEREGATELHFLYGLSFAAGASYKVFPLQLIKSITKQCKMCSELLDFKNSYQLRFHWLFRSLVRRSTENPCWGTSKWAQLPFIQLLSLQAQPSFDFNPQ